MLILILLCTLYFNVLIETLFNWCLLHVLNLSIMTPAVARHSVRM